MGVWELRTLHPCSFILAARRSGNVPVWPQENLRFQTSPCLFEQMFQVQRFFQSHNCLITPGRAAQKEIISSLCYIPHIRTTHDRELSLMRRLFSLLPNWIHFILENIVGISEASSWSPYFFAEYTKQILRTLNSDFSDTRKCVLSFTSIRYWYISCFIIIYVVSCLAC